MRFDFIKEQLGNEFYPVSEKEIEDVESSLGLKFPNDLREFLLEVGDGFLKKSENNINRIMGPTSIRDARFKVNNPIYYDEIRIANSLEEFLRKMMDDYNYYVDME
ncbi:SMI1/KNR4 family protein [Fictibacillus fluitans]|uniref:SMI1/KNR4 family protein n=1 Tax=Fictibacillus fluitans TaxID=3058422 RepID=A0ABT8HT75_9BACL|nr:SMI1/KNR4 family protein [Fictibacillus sp. NE201]MDN4523980.1 SMI1/KNR4 family protein [Fictibacillus sp. NE201]